MIDVAAAIDSSPLNRGLKGAEWVANPENVAVTFPDGGLVLFDAEGGRMYEAHVLLKARGAEAIRQGKAACAEMFEKHGAEVLLGLTPDFLKAARFFARKVGFQSLGMVETAEGPCEVFQMIKGQFL